MRKRLWLWSVQLANRKRTDWAYSLEIALFEIYCRKEYREIWQSQRDQWNIAFERNSYMMMDNLGIDVRQRPHPDGWGLLLEDMGQRVQKAWERIVVEGDKNHDRQTHT